MNYFSLLAAAESALPLAEEGEGGNILETELAVVGLLAVAALVAVFVRRIKIPYTVALVVVGLVLALFPTDLLTIDISPNLILAILVPPLLFEATLHLPWAKLRADLGVILVVAIGGTLVGAFMVGGIVQSVLGWRNIELSWLAALAFGALISATDPVAVIAFFKSLGVDKRLAVLVEGESLFNDAAAIVLFGLAVEAAEPGGGLTIGEGLRQFVVVGGGGLVVGLVLGYVVSNIILKNVDDHLIETVTSVALAYGSYLVAEEFGLIFGIEDFHLSGILAVVASGLMVGTFGLLNTSPTTRLAIDNFWELLSFMANSLVFLIIGLVIDLRAYDLDSIIAVAVAVVAILLSRLVVVYGIGAVHRRVQPARLIPMPFRHVQYWGGLRGAISLALALLLAEKAFEPDQAETIKLMTFGVVLFTLLVQGMTISGVIDRLGLAGRPHHEMQQQRHQALLHAQRAGRARLKTLGDEGVLFTDMTSSLLTNYDEQIESTSDSLRDHVQVHQELEMAMLVRARRDALDSERTAVISVAREGLIDEEVAAELSLEYDTRTAALDLIEDRWERNPAALEEDED